MTPFKVLIVENQPIWQENFRRKIEMAFPANGATEVRAVSTAEDGLNALRNEGLWHLAIVDIGLSTNKEDKLGKLSI